MDMECALDRQARQEAFGKLALLEFQHASMLSFNLYDTVQRSLWRGCQCPAIMSSVQPVPGKCCCSRSMEAFEFGRASVTVAAVAAVWTCVNVCERVRVSAQCECSCNAGGMNEWTASFPLFAQALLLSLSRRHALHSITHAARLPARPGALAASAFSADWSFGNQRNAPIHLPPHHPPMLAQACRPPAVAPGSAAFQASAFAADWSFASQQLHTAEDKHVQKANLCGWDGCFCRCGSVDARWDGGAVSCSECGVVFCRRACYDMVAGAQLGGVYAGAQKVLEVPQTSACRAVVGF
eukprot:28985-Chlamydomonas_euryale.AAC.1